MDNVTNPAEICPVDVELELNGKTYTLKKWTLKVDAWVEARFGKSKIELFKSMTPEELGKLIFHLIENKKDFQAEDCLGYDDDGREYRYTETGPDKVMQAISGSKKEAEVVEKLLECYGLSMPQIKHLTGSETEEAPISAASKKKTKAKKKLKSLTGGKSLT